MRVSSVVTPLAIGAPIRAFELSELVMSTLERKQWIERRRKAHHKALVELVPLTNELNGLRIWQRLRRVESSMRKANELCCNGDINMEQWEKKKEHCKAAVWNIFGGRLPKGFFINGDPRGCALKLDPEIVTIPEGMEKDWGGNGILAAEIDED